MDDRLVVVGMCNPLSDAPALALWTDPDGCTGHRLWSLATGLTGVSEDEWLALTDRRNLCVGDWDRRRAEEQAREWAPELRDRTVVLLGTSVMTAMVRVGELARPLAPLEWARDRDWFLLPHTSGLCRWYNSQVCRMAAQIRLAELLGEMGCAEDQRSGEGEEVGRAGVETEECPPPGEGGVQRQLSLLPDQS